MGHTVAPEVKSCFSNAQLFVARNAGHIAISDQPRQVIFNILSFLQLPPDANMETSVLTPEAIAPVVPQPQESAPTPSSVEAPKEGMSKADRAAQMPVPMIFGHTDAGATGSHDTP